jgi:hypothetical protein
MCGNTFDSDFPEELDIAETPGLLEEIMKGAFLTVTCEKCGIHLRPEFPLRITGFTGAKGAYSDIMFIPELERDSFLFGKRDYSGDRVVIGRPELMEKTSVYHSSLDDRALEVLKYLLLEKMDSRDDVKIYYFETMEEEITFQIYGLKPNEVGITRIPMDLYRRVEADIPRRLKEEPFREILMPPYVSVSKISMEVSS